jgi:two-component system chemotaxis response regulator CheY
MSRRSRPPRARGYHYRESERLLGSNQPSIGSVLVVDDEVSVREVIREVLEDEGFATLAARDGLDAVRRLRSGLRPCVIVLDLMMPRMSGWEFASWLRSEEDLRSIPFVVVTAYETDTESDAVRYADAVLQKPLRIGELIEFVSRRCAAQETVQ